MITLALAACGGTTEEQQKVEATGAAATSSTGGTSADGADDGVLTRDELASLAQPRTGPHEVWSTICNSGLISQDYRVLPRAPICSASDENPEIICDLLDYCEGPSDCTEGDRGRCEREESGFCGLPHDVADPCTKDADCDLIPEGECSVNASGMYCDSSGCEFLGSRCKYPESPCSMDSDCPAGVACIRHIVHSRCRYDICTSDSDCEAGERCGCATCVPADCSSDSDCGAGHSCALAMPCSSALGFHCTTDDDECDAGDRECNYITKDAIWSKTICK